ncbi:hypothetical protein AB0I81_03820 [Nonomuraea sp. NPDC050404]|uniref:hypothetical protein n=1 Tax=Nonomuraea sp. NPDC050404 TaxID=3155783 RepID=UPI00340D2E1A
MPSGEHAVPPGEHAMPPDGHAVPPGESAVPPGESAVPPGESAVPSGEHAMPPDGRAMSSGKRAMSSGKRAVPSKKWAVPSLGRIVAPLVRAGVAGSRGLLIQGTITVESALLGERGTHEVLLRLSRGPILPGVLTLAVRLPTGVDLVMFTGYAALPVPRRAFTAGPYSTLASYQCGPRRHRLVARPEGERVPADPALLPATLGRGPLLFHLWAGARYLARLRAHTPLPGRELSFDPFRNSDPALHPASARLWWLWQSACGEECRKPSADIREKGADPESRSTN